MFRAHSLRAFDAQGLIEQGNVIEIGHTHAATAEAVRRVLEAPVDYGNGRADFAWFTLASGDSLLGVFPQGDLYEVFSQTEIAVAPTEAEVGGPVSVLVMTDEAERFLVHQALWEFAEIIRESSDYTEAALERVEALRDRVNGQGRPLTGGEGAGLGLAVDYGPPQPPVESPEAMFAAWLEWAQDDPGSARTRPFEAAVAQHRDAFENQMTTKPFTEWLV